MTATKNMSDAELRKELQKLGFTPGPITDSTRGVLQKKLQQLKSGSASSQKTSKESERARKGQGSTRSRRSEPIRNKREVWENDDEDEEEEESYSHRANVSSRQSRTLDRKSYGGSGRLDREDGKFSYDSRSAASTHMADTEPWRSDRPSLTGSHLTRGTADYSDDIGYENRYSLGAQRFPRTSYEYGSSAQEASSSLVGERFPRSTFDSGSLGQETRSLLGGEKFPRTTFDSGSLGKETRPSLGGDRFSRTAFDSGSLGQEARSYLGGERFPRTTYEYGSSGLEARSSLGGDRIPRTTFDSGSLGQDARFSLSSERFTRNTPESSAFPGQELRSRLSERSSLSNVPLSRGEDRYRSRYEQDAKDQHSYDKNSSRRYPSQSQPNWSRTLEYYLSKVVKTLSVGLLIVFFGIIIMKSEIFNSTEQDDIKLIPPDCEGKHDKYCQAMQKQIILQILSELYNFLSLEAGSFECGNPSGLSSKCIPLKRAKAHVIDVLEHSPQKFDSAIDWLLDRNEHLGIWAKGEDGEIVTTSSLVFCVESSRPHLGITCRLTNGLYTAISNLFLALFGVFVLWLFLIYLRYHWRKLEEEEKQMFAMVEKIIDVVKLHYKGYQQGIEQNPYIGISHVRDMLIMPQDRKRLKKVWDRAVQFVKDNESRLRTELQRVAGADLLVWRWTQTRYELPSERSSPTLLSTWSK